VAEEIRDGGFRELPITFHHAIAAGRLPMIHRDPFDRMLVAQAQCEGLTLASRDPHIQRYDALSYQCDPRDRRRRHLCQGVFLCR